MHVVAHAGRSIACPSVGDAVYPATRKAGDWTIPCILDSWPVADPVNAPGSWAPHRTTPPLVGGEPSRRPGPQTNSSPRGLASHRTKHRLFRLLRSLKHSGPRALRPSGPQALRPSGSLWEASPLGDLAPRQNHRPEGWPPTGQAQAPQAPQAPQALRPSGPSGPSGPLWEASPLGDLRMNFMFQEGRLQFIFDSDSRPGTGYGLPVSPLAALSPNSCP